MPDLHYLQLIVAYVRHNSTHYSMYHYNMLYINHRSYQRKSLTVLISEEQNSMSKESASFIFTLTMAELLVRPLGKNGPQVATLGYGTTGLSYLYGR
jgi:hypothetical protein